MTPEYSMRGVFVIAVVICVAPDRPDPSPRPESPALDKHLIGDWLVTKHIVSGNDTMLDGLTMVFSPTALQQVYDRNGVKSPAGSYNYVLDMTRHPAVISFRQTKYEGIIKIEGETLTICFAAPGSSQPPTQ